MRIGVISDPHGCLAGLQAALEWLGTENVDMIVCAGDVANFGPQPNECIALLDEREIPTVMGNSDYELLSPSPTSLHGSARRAQIDSINQWGKEQLTPASYRWLDSLPMRLSPAPGVLIVHGGLNRFYEIVDADATPSFPPGIGIVAAGHLHVPFINYQREGIWVNAGSAGASCDGDPRAALAILESHTQGWKPTIHRVPFDLNAAAQAIRKAKMPYAERLIQNQLRATWW